MHSLEAGLQLYSPVEQAALKNQLHSMIQPNELNKYYNDDLKQTLHFN